MGLEDFKSEDENEIGSVTTRKKIENVTYDKEAWRRLMYHHPSIMETIAWHTNTEGVKAMVQLADEIVQGEADIEGWSEEQADMVETYRNNVVEEHLEDSET